MAKIDFGALWDRRDRLAAELAENSLLPERTLYLLRADGGVSAVGSCAGAGKGFVLDWGPKDCRLRAFGRARFTAEPFEQEALGFGGLFGAGEKGARGWMLRVSEGGDPALEAPLLPGITAVADLPFSDDRFLNGRRRRADVPHWQLAPQDRETCAQIVKFWETRLTERFGK